MLKQKRALSISVIIATLGLVGCGSKVAGTYTLSQMSSMNNLGACSQVVLNLTSSGNNAVSAVSASATCNEILTGIDNGNGSITVQSLVITPTSTYTQQYPQYQNQNTSCTYTGMLSVSGNQVTGTLTASTTGGTYGQTVNYNCGSITINGTKN